MVFPFKLSLKAFYFGMEWIPLYHCRTWVLKTWINFCQYKLLPGKCVPRTRVRGEEKKARTVKKKMFWDLFFEDTKTWMFLSVCVARWNEFWSYQTYSSEMRSVNIGCAKYANYYFFQLIFDCSVKQSRLVK